MALADPACPQCGQKPDPLARARAWQAQGLELQRRVGDAGPALQVQASEAFSRSLELDPANETVHQLWIASLNAQGRGAEALAYYRRRLEAVPEDALALRMQKVATLSLQFTANPVKVEAVAVRPTGLFARMLAWALTPGSTTLGIAASSLLLSLGLLVAGLMMTSSDPLIGALLNPGTNGLSAVLWGLYLVVLLRGRKK
jgi:hypothetical protein